MNFGRTLKGARRILVAAASLVMRRTKMMGTSLGGIGKESTHSMERRSKLATWPA